ncbi:MAG: ATP-binding cassette domain-containing protein [Tissierellia bacterium]|nr:ATP-binding cassette domain-containing protein [Tissierellia bacterium]
MSKEVLFSVKNLKKYFPVKKTKLFQREQYYVHANESITLDIYKGETLGLVGESGCGKSTFGRTLIQLYNQTEGSTLYYGKTLDELAPKYVGDVLNDIGTRFNDYKKAQQELERLQTGLDSLEGLELAERKEQIMFKNKEIENKYTNMARLAGGLLVHKDLQKVSSVLKEKYALDVQRARAEARIAQAKLDSEAADTSSIEGEIKDIDEKIAEVQKKVDELYKEAEIEEDFARYEDLKDSEGVDLSQLTYDEMRDLRKDIQIIFQDPYSSLNTRMTIGQIIGEGITAHGMFKSQKDPGYNEYIQEVMNECGLQPYFIHRYPHQFSGGQRQRIGIARALALKPKFIVCDEAVSALDVSIQSQILNLLQDLRENNDLTYLFITHDLSVVKYISDRIGVMYLGNVVELAPSEAIFEEPLHPYTKALLEAIPRTDTESGDDLKILGGDVPSAVTPPPGCRFHTRCEFAKEECMVVQPELREIKEGHFVACHLYDEE